MFDRHRLVQERLVKLRAARGNPLEIVQQLEAQTPEQLTEMLPALFTAGYAADEGQALRDVLAAVLYRKLTDSLIASIDALNASTTRLTKVGWWWTGIVGAVGVLVSLALWYAGRF